eukprot:s3745_g9.t1
MHLESQATPDGESKPAEQAATLKMHWRPRGFANCGHGLLLRALARCPGGHARLRVQRMLLGRRVQQGFVCFEAAPITSLPRRAQICV